MKTGPNHDQLAAALQASNETTRSILAGATKVMDEANALLRRRAAQIAKRRTRRARPPMPPPPVASLLHGFSRALADKIEAINACLPDDVRDRLRAIAPGFERAVVSNDPDVVQMFGVLLVATPDDAARWMTEQVDLLERRFAS